MMLVQRMDALRQDTHKIEETVYSVVESIVGTKFGKALIWPTDSRLVRDTNQLKLVVAPRHAYCKEDDPELRAQLYVDDILKNVGTNTASTGIRSYSCCLPRRAGRASSTQQIPQGFVGIPKFITENRPQGGLDVISHFIGTNGIIQG